MSARTRSNRLNTLLRMALNGKTQTELRNKCKQWGVTQVTENSYMVAVNHRKKMMKK